MPLYIIVKSDILDCKYFIHICCQADLDSVNNVLSKAIILEIRNHRKQVAIFL